MIIFINMVAVIGGFLGIYMSFNSPLGPPLLIASLGYVAILFGISTIIKNQRLLLAEIKKERQKVKQEEKQ